MMLNVATNEYINNNIFSLIKRLTNALRCTFTCYAIETILTTNRTDSLQYTALIAAYKAYPPYGTRTRYLSLLGQMLSNALPAPPPPQPLPWADSLSQRIGPLHIFLSILIT